ncbi:PHB depolymerase family esterase [Sphingobium sp.]|uniref:extracellular catalytic domain type 1 short-chain-length polyhydroxyalkanoate depolymerase n=1 Tax=Sphingobium sp. TaxID=1912891 RepID=UPI002D1C8B6C|nr:PHB depolymerase family esterase [Sphingobium sp.]HUD92879.1 PHB depolymerase family esterase [Sphingobium sp.]
MTKLHSTIAQLGKLRALSLQPSPPSDRGQLSDMEDFGSNPGALRARYYLPQDLGGSDRSRHVPLVVVLHGCTQNADAYDYGAGWSQLADELGFALLFPEQRHANNPNRCFNWFAPGDSARDTGEPLSIRQMIAAMVAAHLIDEARIYVTGLSAGGAMTSIMLATYPELFAGGAIIAGLPYGAAASVPEAFASMRGEGYPDDAVLGALIRSASDHAGPWPTISVWQGDADRTVHASNAERIIAQWQAVHGSDASDVETRTVDGARQRLWRDRDGRVAIEAYEVIGMGHGTPLAVSGPGACGVASPYMLDAGISSTRHIAAFWGLAEEKAAMPVEVQAGVQSDPIARVRDPIPFPLRNGATPSRQESGRVNVGAIIENALRRAGIMR